MLKFSRQSDPFSRISEALARPLLPPMRPLLPPMRSWLDTPITPWGDALFKPSESAVAKARQDIDDRLQGHRIEVPISRELTDHELDRLAQRVAKRRRRQAAEHESAYDEDMPSTPEEERPKFRSGPFSSMDRLKEEMERRAANGELEKSSSAEARYLARFAKKNLPRDEANRIPNPPTQKTICNRLGRRYKELFPVSRAMVKFGTKS